MSVRAIILAAGQGTRMKTALPKVLHPLAGAPMIDWVCRAVTAVSDDVWVVVGHGADEVRAVLPASAHAVVQEEQLGTGHATQVALGAIGEVAGDTVLVVPGDAPAVTPSLFQRLMDVHVSEGASVTLVSTQLEDPTGYGRLLRDDAGNVVGIVEEGDANASQRAIREVGVSIYAFDGSALGKALDRLDQDNSQGELYLTDVVEILSQDGAAISAVPAAAAEVQGVNSHGQLARAAAELRRRINDQWMEEGVWMLDPARVYLDASVRLAAGVRLYPDVHLEGVTTVAAGAELGPSVFAVDSEIGEGARVWFSVLRGAAVGPSAEVGPYASLRPGTVLEADARAGTFVETKNTRLGRGSKVPHLSYMGDADIGEDSNIGAGTITCNYDGFEKHETVIGDRVRVGSDTMLIAPVEIGDDAWTGAGSAISRDVPPGALGITRSPQREIPDYAARREARQRDQRTAEED